MSLIASDVNLEIGRLLAYDVSEMIRLGIPRPEAEAIRAEFIGWTLKPVPAPSSPSPTQPPTVLPRRRRGRPPGPAKERTESRPGEYSPTPYECFDGGIGINLPTWVLAGLPVEDVDDLDALTYLRLPAPRKAAA